MNQPIPEFVSYVPVPCVCDGVIIAEVEGSSTYDVSVNRTAVGDFQGTVRATPIYHDPMPAPDYKLGDNVKVLAVFLFDVNNNRFDTVAKNFQTQILGKYDPEVIIDTTVDNPIVENSADRVVIKNKKSDAGIVMTDNHELTQTPGGAVSHTLKAFGKGVTKNCDYARAQNYHRVISHNDPLYASREHFGMYTGKSTEDEATRPLPVDSLINYRRFVQQTRDPGKWVSTCEGAYAPWLGMNNSNEEVDIGKEVLFTRVVNSDTTRVTHEQGEAGADFIMTRVDSVKVGEKSAPTPTGATPALLGNKFKMAVSDEGEIEVYAAGKGIPAVNFAGFKMTLNADGELNIQAAKKITLSHSDADEVINSITMDTNGVAVNAMSGFTVNGKKLVNENFINFLQTFGATGIAVSVLPPGSPEPLHPLFITNLNAQAKVPDVSPFGFLTAGVPIPILGVIAQPDNFSTS